MICPGVISKLPSYLLSDWIAHLAPSINNQVRAWPRHMHMCIDVRGGKLSPVEAVPRK